MNLYKLALRNLKRHLLRTSLTMLGLAIAVVAFVALRTVLTAWSAAADFAAKDRIATRHKMSFVIPLPKKYAATVASMPGIKAVTYMNWFGAKNPKKPEMFFATMATDPETFLEVYDEITLPPEHKSAWFKNRKGAIIGDVLAKELGAKAGDTIFLDGTIFPGSWEFKVEGIYIPTRQTIDRMSLFFHWNYLNESLHSRQKDQIGWLTIRVDSPTKGPQIAKAIDTLYDESDSPTLTQSERDMGLSFLGMLSGLLKALDIVSIVILGIMMMILGNTIAMGVRERTRDYGVLRALGFPHSHVIGLIMGESAFMGLMSGVLGLLLAYPIVQQGMGRWLEENMGTYFPYFRIDPSTAVTALLMCAALGVIASILPAYGAARKPLTDALRQVGT